MLSSTSLMILSACSLFDKQTVEPRRSIREEPKCRLSSAHLSKVMHSLQNGHNFLRISGEPEIRKKLSLFCRLSNAKSSQCSTAQCNATQTILFAYNNLLKTICILLRVNHFHFFRFSVDIKLNGI